MSTYRRGGVSARNYVVHIKRDAARTLCNRIASKVNCATPPFDATAEEICKRCRVAVEAKQMPASMPRSTRLRIESAVGCTTCNALSGYCCYAADGHPCHPHVSRIRSYKLAHKHGGPRPGAGRQTVPVDLGDALDAYRALDAPERRRVREAGAVAMRALLRRG